MFEQFLKKIFGSSNDRYIKKICKDIEQINALEAQFSQLIDEELQNKTNEFKERLEKGEILQDILHEAFATVREASKRVTGMRHFDVQLIGGIILHEGRIAEMKTGEGKTLVATCPVYLNALEGKGVHVVTVNDYLAKRDAEWMSQIYNFLGLSCGIIVHGLTDEERRNAYHSDITYGTNHEFGFDYLRDNMKFYKRDLVQREFNYAIVDEVDSILIDEARTPLIISGPAEDSSELYIRISDIIKTLVPEDYEKDEKDRNITLTEIGNEKVERLLKENGIIDNGLLYDLKNIHIVHYVNQLLKAWNLFEKDVDYVVKDGKIVIVDEFTGRMMEGRRYSDGLHQAIEAKEGVQVQQENQTLASITYQNFFRLYKKLSGMTGTAMTEAEEFQQIYNLSTSVVPTNLPVARVDENDEVYITFREKCNAIIKQIKECNARQQPVLVGTASIEKSEIISSYLKKEGIKHNVLNAKFHEYEAQIIADAGMPGAVTIATNMAGRGTDIKLGGNFETQFEELKKSNPNYTEQDKKDLLKKIEENAELVRKAGGLYIIGTERHESRRIDNQLRGRSGRQGDPGHSKFFISLEDDLMKIFGSERLKNLSKRLNLGENEAIVNPMVTKCIEKAQSRVEARNFEIRKHLLKFDNVMSEQRKIVYAQRQDLINEEYDINDDLYDFFDDIIKSLSLRYFDEHGNLHEIDVDDLHAFIMRIFGIDMKDLQSQSLNEIKETLKDSFEAKLKEKKELCGSQEEFNRSVKAIILKTLDKAWKNHLLSLDHLRQGINLRAYAQKDPLNEYKIEAFNFFEAMIQTIKEESIEMFYRLEMNRFSFEDFENFFLNAADDGADLDDLEDEQNQSTDDLEIQAQIKRFEILRKNLLRLAENSNCYCGSGRKFKDCHGLKERIERRKDDAFEEANAAPQSNASDAKNFNDSIDQNNGKDAQKSENSTLNDEKRRALYFSHENLQEKLQDEKIDSKANDKKEGSDDESDKNIE